MAAIESVSVFAPAKINLYLHVTGKRTDGYHLLDSLMVFAGIGDTVTAAPAPSLALTVEGPFAKGLDAGSDNLVLKAARALQDATGSQQGAALTLTKRLPSPPVSAAGRPMRRLPSKRYAICGTSNSRKKSSKILPCRWGRTFPFA